MEKKKIWVAGKGESKRETQGIERRKLRGKERGRKLKGEGESYNMKKKNEKG